MGLTPVCCPGEQQGQQQAWRGLPASSPVYVLDTCSGAEFGFPGWQPCGFCRGTNCRVQGTHPAVRQTWSRVRRLGPGRVCTAGPESSPRGSAGRGRSGLPLCPAGRGKSRARPKLGAWGQAVVVQGPAQRWARRRTPGEPEHKWELPEENHAPEECPWAPGTVAFLHIG